MADRIKHAKTVEFGQVEIQQNEIWGDAGDQFDGTFTVARLAHNLVTEFIGAELPQDLTKK